MYIKILYFILLMFGNLSYVFIFYLIFNQSIDTIGYSLINSIVSTIFMALTLNLLEKKYKNNNIDIFSFIVLIFSIYFQLSCVKYTSVNVYGFIDNNVYRLLSTIICILTLIFWVVLINYFFKGKCSFNIKNIENIFNIKSKYIFIMLSILFYFQVISNDLSRNSILSTNTSEDRIISLIFNIYISLVLSICAVNFKRKYGKLYLVIILITYSIRAIFIGQRSELIIPITIYGYILLLTRSISIKKMKNVFPILGVIYLGFSLIVFNVSGRFDSSRREFSIMYLANRFDLVDFPYTLYENSINEGIGKDIIVDGIINSIPRAVFKDKDNYYNNSYESNIYYAGLDESLDYPDSYLSMGVEVGGMIGGIFIICFILLFMKILNFNLVKMGEIGFLVLSVNLKFIFNIEHTWNSFLAGIVSLVISYIIIKLLFTHYVWRKKKVEYINN